MGQIKIINILYKPVFYFTLFLFIQIYSINYNVLSAQNTLGVTLFEDEAFNGYTFFSNFSGTDAYLIDNCGRLINKWDRNTRPGIAAYFLENGMMLRTYKPNTMGPFTSASNSGGLEMVDWNNNTVWNYELNTDTQLSHHDAIMMPNGNFLLLTWELEFTEDLIAWGRDPKQIAQQGFMWSEKVIEVEPSFPEGGTVVWEWNIKDHYIQDFDPTKENFGVVEDHPELFDINLPELNSGNSNATRDWNHFNAIDYNETLDQILISTRNSDEIWILDHSTSIAEAGSHSGGRYGKGGDILYRWGNASAYRQALVSDQELFGQHGVHWIKDGLEDAGKIMIFNNGNGRPGTDYSSVEILDPPQDSLGFYTSTPGAPFGPEESTNIFGSTSSFEFFYSAFLSNAQRLENGNTLVNNGSNGTVFEITPNKDIVWIYRIPLNGDFPLSQGQNHNGNGDTFRAYKYPIDYPGFEGLDLTPGDVIEFDSDPEPCLLSNTEESTSNDLKFTFNQYLAIIKLDNYDLDVEQLFISDNLGRIIARNIHRRSIKLPHDFKGKFYVTAVLENGQSVTYSNVKL